MLTGKERVLELLDRLPDDCSLEDVLCHLYVLRSIDRGLRGRRHDSARRNLTASGSLRLLRDQELRHELAFFVGLTGRLQARATTLNDQWREVEGSTDLDLFEPDSELRELKSNVTQVDLSDLVRFRPFRNFAVARRGAAEDAIRDHGQALETVERILARVGSQ